MNQHENSGVGRRFVISISLTLGILIFEILGGLWTGSLALLSDAAHVFMDIFALALSYAALRFSALPADDEHTYGYHRLEVLAALVNGVTLIIIAVGIWHEAYERWLVPQQVRSMEMLGIAVIGLLINIVVALVLGGHAHKHDHTHEHGPNHDHVDDTVKKDLNLRSAYLHVIGDAISSVGVIAAAVVIRATGLVWFDPLASILIGVIIMISAYRVTRDALHILVEGTPRGISRQKVSAVLMEVPDVKNVHDLHIWSICSGNIALSAHIVLKQAGLQQPDTVMAVLKERLDHGFGIQHTTIQFEENECEGCPGGCQEN